MKKPVEGVAKLERKLLRIGSEKDLRLASLRASNKAATTYRTAVSRDAARQIRLKVKIIRNRITIKRAVGRKPYAWILINRNDVNAMAAGTPKQTDTGAEVGSGKNKHRFPGSFREIITHNPVRPGPPRTEPRSGIGDMHIFSRAGKRRYPLKIQRIKVADKMLSSLKLKEHEALEMLEKQLAASLRDRIRRLTKK